MKSGVTRLVVTSDLLGGGPPLRTTYGYTPGEERVWQAVHALREGAQWSLWIDTGDLTAGGPDTESPAVVLNKHVAAGLDVFVCGNHDLDEGLEAFQELARRRLVTTLGGGLPELQVTTTEQLGGTRFTIIGLVHPRLDRLSGLPPWPPVLMPQVLHEAARARQNGSGAVILAIHDGADWSPSFSPTRGSLVRLERLLEPLLPHVDLVLGGHTLVDLCSTILGVPYVQSAAFGASIGVVDFGPSGNLLTARTAITPTDPLGLPAHDGSPLAPSPTEIRAVQGARPYLPQVVAESRAAAVGSGGAIVFGAELFTQPPLDGCAAAILSPVSDRDVRRLYPSDPELVEIYLTLREVRKLASIVTDGRHGDIDWCPITPGVTLADPAGSIDRERPFVVTEFMVGVVAEILTKEITPRPLAMTASQALLDGLPAEFRRT